jgi:hypothetical protein
MTARTGHCSPACAAFGSALLIGLATLTVSPRAARADDVSGAANAFSRAQKAELSADFAAAAELYELADSLAPAPEALRSALRARKSAGQLEIAAVRAEELIERYPTDAKSTELANQTLEEAAKKLMRYEVACRPSACTLLVDGAAASSDAKERHLVYLAPGKHEMRATFGRNQTDPQSAEGTAGARGSLSFDAPPEPPEQRADPAVAGDGGPADQGTQHQKGLSPWFFVGGAIATAGLGAATIWSGLDVLSAHDDYKKNPTSDAYNEGRSKELRTNVLIGATSVVGAATAVIAIFTDWGGKHGETAQTGVHATACVTGSSAAIVVGGVY